MEVRPGVIGDDIAADGRRYLGWAAAIRGTPWIVLLEFPRSAIVAPARTFLLGMLGAAALLVLAAAVAAHALSARITTPLLQLTPERAIEWTIGPLPVVEGDPSMLRLVFVNLRSNAVNYSSTRPLASIEVGIEVGTLDVPGETVLFVRDNGVG